MHPALQRHARGALAGLALLALGVSGPALAQTPLRGGGLNLSPARVRQVQQRLGQEGYDAGPVNGVWNARTARALRGFKQAHGLSPTGRVTRRSLVALGLLRRHRTAARHAAATTGAATQTTHTPHLQRRGPGAASAIGNGAPGAGSR